MRTLKLRNQMRRLFGCSGFNDLRRRARFSNSLILADRRAGRVLVERAQARSSPVAVGQQDIFRLRHSFNEIIEPPRTAQHEHPHGPQTLRTLGLDLYLWLVYRTFALRAPLRLSWQQVYGQFGADPAKAER